MRTQPSESAQRAASVRAFMLTEVMIASVLLTVVLGGLVCASLYGLRMYHAADLKANTSDQARMGVSRLTGDIQSARLSRVGIMKSGAFYDIPEGEPQQGNALKLQFTTDTNFFLLYYLDPSDHVLKRWHSGSQQTTKVAQSVRNTAVFQSEDHLGSLLTNSQNGQTIRVQLQFFETQYPKAAIGPGSLFERYKLETCVTHRVTE